MNRLKRGKATPWMRGRCGRREGGWERERKWEWEKGEGKRENEGKRERERERRRDWGGGRTISTAEQGLKKAERH
jgi:hypothetical protein